MGRILDVSSHSEYRTKNIFNCAISAVMTISGITTLVLLVLTALTGAKILPNSIVSLSLFSSCSIISAIIFLACSKLRMCPRQNFTESSNKVEKARSEVEKVQQKSENLLEGAQIKSEENRKKREQEANEEEARKVLQIEKEGIEERYRMQISAIDQELIVSMEKLQQARSASEQKTAESKEYFKIANEKLDYEYQITSTLSAINKELIMVKTVLDLASITEKQPCAENKKFIDERLKIISSNLEKYEDALRKLILLGGENEKIPEYEKDLKEVKMAIEIYKIPT